MSALQAAITAAITGLMCGVIIELLLDISLEQAMFRVLVLTAAAGLMGALLVWLHEGLESIGRQEQDEADRP
jgi:Na+/citrate or Na+/malate symporter